MTDSNFPLSADDDLPRTFRRARQEHEAAQRAASPAAPLPGRETMAPIAPAIDGAALHHSLQEPPPATVSDIQVPFLRLMLFFIKAVFAAIPALIILGVLIWTSGEILTAYHPELLKMKILIQFPN